MARTALSVQSIVPGGLAASYSAATVDGFGFDNSSGKVFLHVKNANASSVTVTIDVPTGVKVDGDLAVPDRTVTVTNGTDKFIGPFSKAVYNRDSATPDISEAVWVNFSIQASVTVAALKLG